jgi:DnaJ-class molecular chaperone
VPMTLGVRGVTMRRRFKARDGHRCPRCRGTRMVLELRIGHGVACPTCQGTGSIGAANGWSASAGQSDHTGRLARLGPEPTAEQTGTPGSGRI